MIDLGAAIRQAIGRRLRGLRRGLGWTLEDLTSRARAEGIRLSVSTLHRMETGASALPLETISVVCRLLGTTLGHLDELLHNERVLLAESQADDLPAAPELEEVRRVLARGRYPRALLMLEALLHALNSARSGGDQLRQRAETLLLICFCQRKLRHYRLSHEAAAKVLNMPGCPEDLRLKAVLLQIEIHSMRDETFEAKLLADYAKRTLLERRPMLDDSGRDLAPFRSSILRRTRAFGSFVLGHMYLRQNALQQAVVWLTRAREAYRELGTIIEVARATTALADAALRGGDLQTAGRLAHEAYRQAKKGRFWDVAASALRILGRIDVAGEHPDAARFHFERAASLARRAGLEHEHFLACFGLWNLARIQGEAPQERRAKKVLHALLAKIDMAELPEAQSFVGSLRPPASSPRPGREFP